MMVLYKWIVRPMQWLATIKTNAIPWSQASLQNNWRFIVHPAVKQITFDTLACSLSALLSLHWTRSLQIVDPNLDFQIQLALGPDQPLKKQLAPNWQFRIRSKNGIEIKHFRPAHLFSSFHWFFSSHRPWSLESWRCPTLWPQSTSSSSPGWRKNYLWFF